MLTVSVPPPPNKAKVPQPVVVQVLAIIAVEIVIELGGVGSEIPLIPGEHPVHAASNVEIVTLVPAFNAFVTLATFVPSIV